MKAVLRTILAIIGCVALTVTGCGSTDTDAGVREGEKAPDFTLKTPDGNSISLSDFQGKPVIITFWSVSCKACVDGVMPDVQAVCDKRPNNDFVVLAINEMDTAANAKEFVDKRGFTFAVLLLDRQNKVRHQYAGIGEGLPVTLFISAEGIYEKKQIGAFGSQEDIESILDSL